MISANAGAHSGTGGWMVALLECLRKRSDIQLAVACVYPGLEDHKIDFDGIEYFCIAQGKVRRLLHYTNTDDNPVFIDKCACVVQEWKPDLIHIHGTERFYGLLSSHQKVKCPIVISIQGLLTEYCKWRYTFGDLSIREVIQMHHPLRLLRGIGPLWDYVKLRKSALREEGIIRRNRYFMGRTNWDQAHVKAINPSAYYFHVDELLRPEFRECQQDLNCCRRHSIIFTNARGPRRDVNTLFKALVLLRKRFSDVSLRLAGLDGFTGEYGLYLSKLAEKEGVRQNLEFLGSLNAEQMSKSLASSHVFVLSSLIENSPNSLCEAQTVGLPCVATYTGGVPSLISDGQTGFMVPVGDASMIAERIARIFESDKLAEELGRSARNKALARHDPVKVTERVVEVYRDVSVKMKYEHDE